MKLKWTRVLLVALIIGFIIISIIYILLNLGG